MSIKCHVGHASVQASPLLLQEHFSVHEDFEHWQLTSSKILSGAGGFVIN